MIDTVLLSALLHCHPSRRNAIVDFLSSVDPVNRCHLETSAILLAAQGNSFTEALLWLFRSHNEHKKVLAALVEERCVGTGAGVWTREQFYHWTAEYLHSLWFSEDANLPALALNFLRPVLEYDAELGLSVLLPQSTSLKSSAKGGVGGKGTDIQDILSFLELVKLKPMMAPKGASALTFIATTVIAALNQARRNLDDDEDMENSKLLADKDTNLTDAPLLRLPLVNG